MDDISYYTDPSTMSPLLPEDPSGRLENLAIQLIAKSAKLSGTLNPTTRFAIAEFLRPMNSYYSNLIEGHDTHPIDIDKVLKNDYSENKVKKDLQIEANAHIDVHKNIYKIYHSKEKEIPTSSSFLKFIHKSFYDRLPEDFKTVKLKNGDIKNVIPGEFRDCEVEVGRHVAPYSENLHLFTERFENFYNPSSSQNASKIKRVISIAASHHRFAWIHPFLDGNGRVVRLFSDAFFMYEELDSSGLWSISRGLARTKDEYQAKLANADQQRYNDYDGRGNLSSRFLFEFCEYFLRTAIDQVEFMYKVLDTENILKRIEAFADLMTNRGKLRLSAKYLLIDLFLKGKISKIEAMRITNTSDKTLKIIVDTLTEQELLIPKREGLLMMYYVKYPIKFSPLIFPGLYPLDKEIDMVNII